MSRQQSTSVQMFMRASIVFALLIIASASSALSAQSDAGYVARLWTSSTNTTYDASGVPISGGNMQISYDQRGELLGVVSTEFLTDTFFGLYQNYYTNEFIYQDRFSFALVQDDVTLTNGFLMQKEHSVTTNYLSADRSSDSGQSRSVTYRTVTTGGGTSSQTILRATNDWASDFQRQFQEVRDPDGHLLSWFLYAWTNDPLHSRQFTLQESGGSDESHPYFIVTQTNVFDSLGNVILSTYENEGGGLNWSTVTSSSYVISPGKKILSSSSQTVETVNASVSSSNVVSSRYEKGLLVEQDSKAFGGDGVYTGETVARSTYDRFGNAAQQDFQQFGPDGSSLGETAIASSSDQFGHLLSQETKYFDGDGILIQRITFANTYLPRGQAVDRSFTTQQFLDQIRARYRNSLTP